MRVFAAGGRSISRGTNAVVHSEKWGEGELLSAVDVAYDAAARAAMAVRFRGGSGNSLLSLE